MKLYMNAIAFYETIHPLETNNIPARKKHSKEKTEYQYTFSSFFLNQGFHIHLKGSSKFMVQETL